MLVKKSWKTNRRNIRLLLLYDRLQSLTQSPHISSVLHNLQPLPLSAELHNLSHFCFLHWLLNPHKSQHLSHGIYYPLYSIIYLMYTLGPDMVYLLHVCVTFCYPVLGPLVSFLPWMFYMVYMIWLSNLFMSSVTEKGYSRNVSWVIN